MRAASCLALSLLIGCTTIAPIGDIVEAPAVAASGKALSRAELARAIRRGGEALGWRMFAEAPGVFRARLELRSHVAVVGIEHDTASYSIRYLESVNLDADNGTIHEAYNRWVQSLHRAIRRELEEL